MLIGIHNALSPDLLRYLRAMGHGDEIVIVDANFPGDSCAQRIERLPGLSATDALRAILSIMPLDTYVDQPARVMEVVGQADVVPPIVVEFQEVINSHSSDPCAVSAVERHAFYEEARKAYCIVQTAETRLYGNIILSKGIVAPEAVQN